MTELELLTLVILVVLHLLTLSGLWLIHQRLPPPIIPMPPRTHSAPLVLRAVELVTAQDDVEGRSGEAKRHQVYAALQKEFPNVSKRAISRAIETALGG